MRYNDDTFNIIMKLLNTKKYSTEQIKAVAEPSGTSWAREYARVFGNCTEEVITTQPTTEATVEEETLEGEELRASLIQLGTVEDK